MALIFFLSVGGCTTEYIEVEKTVYADKPIYIEQIVERVVEVEKIVEVERVVEITIEVPMELKSFGNVTALREWLGEEGRFVLLGKNKDCDDYALWLQNKGLKDGYLISIEAIFPDEYNKLFTRMEINEPHLMNSVIIGNEYWYIEPQTREIILSGYLD